MFQYERNELSEMELLTMMCVWDAEGDITCQEIMERLRKEYGVDYQDTTVYTFLRKLERKGFITRKRRGVIFFTAIRSKEEYKKTCMEKDMNQWFYGSSTLMAEYIYQNASDEERKKIKEMLNIK